MRQGLQCARNVTGLMPEPVMHAAVMWSFGRLQEFHTVLIKSGSTNKNNIKMTAVLISAVIFILFSVFFSVKRGIIDGYNNVLIIVTEVFSEYCESADMGRILLDCDTEAYSACVVKL